MKTLSIAISVLSLASGAATAADMALKGVVPPPMPSWAGFYIGGHGGYGWKDDPFSFTASTAPLILINGFKSHGWIGGGHLGYNWQYGAMVGGLELDISATGIKGNSETVATPTTIQSYGHDVKLLGTARARIGWTPNSNWLLFGTGGLAWERMEQLQSFTFNFQPGSSSSSTTSTPFDTFGWVLGAGIEARLTGTNWIARLEYLHYDFGHTRQASTSSVNNAGLITNSSNTVGNQTIDVVRAGVSYKFGN